MANYDDMFKTEEERETEKKEFVPFDKSAWIEQKQIEREQAYIMMADTAEKMGKDGNVFRQYHHVQAQFNRYSVGNALLVVAQMPTATRLADFDTWKQNNAYVQKGATGIVLLEPGDEFTREDGSVGVSFNTKKVFDVSQTSLADKQQTASKPDERQFIKAMIAESPRKIKISTEVSEQVGAVYDKDSGMILIRQGMNGSDIIKKLSREIAAVHIADAPERSNVAFNAYCVSYIISKRAGVDVSDYNFTKLPDNIRGCQAKDIRTELSQIRDTANEMITEINKNFEQQKTAKPRDEVR